MSRIIRLVVLVFIVLAGYVVYQAYQKFIHEKEILKQIIGRLTADSRVAEVLVTEVRYEENLKKVLTTIKFLEYDSQGQALEPKYFTFSGNIIQFQSLVIRFDDVLIKAADPFKGKSAYLFWKVFMLDGANTQEYPLAQIKEVPEGYKISAESDPCEKEFWGRFWDYALHGQLAQEMGIKNAQIEAPGTKFVPGVLYTLRIEHDGGIRIDSRQLPSILRGEKIPDAI